MPSLTATALVSGLLLAGAGALQRRGPEAFHFPHGGGSKLDMAGSAVDAGGQVAASLIGMSGVHLRRRSDVERAMHEMLLEACAAKGGKGGKSGGGGGGHGKGRLSLDENGLLGQAAGQAGQALMGRGLDGLDIEPREAKGGSKGGATGGAAGGAGGSPGGGFKMPKSKGSKLDFAGNAVGAAGNVAGALLTPQQQAPQQPQALPVQRRGLEYAAIEAREAKHGLGGGGGGAAGGGGGFHLPKSKGSKLDFAGNALSAAGNVAGALLTPTPQAAPMQAPPMQGAPMQRRGLGGAGIEPREAKFGLGGGGGGGGGFHLPQSKGSKLDFAGSAIGAAGNVAGALLTPQPAAPQAPPQGYY